MLAVYVLFLAFQSSACMHFCFSSLSKYESHPTVLCAKQYQVCMY